MKRLILQTYIVDDIQRDTLNTYKRFPKLERLSRRCFEKYAGIHGVDYEYFTGDDKHNTAHWGRMVMFDRPEYDEVLYVDCDILIHPLRYDDNIFDYPGQGVNKIHFYNHSPYQMINAGVTKWTREECEIMKENIDSYYHPTHNQPAINECFNTHVGDWTYLPYKFNVTHAPCVDTVFEHYAGSKKHSSQMKKCPIWRHYK